MPQKAAALSYNTEINSAPKVVAQGKGEFAQRIIEKAKEFDVPLFANEALVNSLVDLDLNREIAPELYQAVAEVFIWLTKNETKASR